MTATRVDTPRGRYYDVAGARYPSVTHILSAISKPALVNWAASVEREMVVQQAAKLYEDLSRGEHPIPASATLGDVVVVERIYPASWFASTLTARLGVERAYQKELAQAGEIGSEVHALIEGWLQRRLVPEAVTATGTPAAMRAFDAFKRWAWQSALEVRLIEHTVYSRAHEYAGTLDAIAIVNNRRMVVDFKTGKAVYPEAHLQNAAYQAAALEMGLGPIDGGLIVRLPKHEADPTFEVVEVAPVDTLLPKFLAAYTLWQFLQEMVR